MSEVNVETGEVTVFVKLTEREAKQLLILVEAVSTGHLDEFYYQLCVALDTTGTVEGFLENIRDGARINDLRLIEHAK